MGIFPLFTEHFWASQKRAETLRKKKQKSKRGEKYGAAALVLFCLRLILLSPEACFLYFSAPSCIKRFNLMCSH